ncbi:MAG TPA: Rid family detoxifying hydrolase [Solirubrobacterales bacterium]|nr:Rid family detoxifying hydrolase [Solirubrobacterales bacterium]
MSEPKTLNSETVAAPIGPYSHASVCAGLLFATGQLPLDADGELVGGGAGAQATQCLANLAAVCASAGTSLDRAVRLGVYVTDLGAFAEVNEAYSRALGEHRPARTTVEVAALPLGAAVEIDAIVAL